MLLIRNVSFLCKDIIRPQGSLERRVFFVCSQPNLITFHLVNN